MRYWLGPWQWVGDGDVRPPGWNPPVGMVASIDLRNVSDCSLFGSNGDRPYGFFCGPDSITLDSDYYLIGRGDIRELKPNAIELSAWQSHLGYRPQGDALVDLLWDQLTNGADPDAVNGPGVLTADANGYVSLVVPGHSVVKSRRFSVNYLTRGRWGAVIKQQLRNQFKRNFERDQKAAERFLWLLERKYGAPWNEFVPRELKEHTRGPRRPETSYSDDFNRADEDLNAGTWTYNTSTSDYEVSSNAVRRLSGSGFYQAEYDANLSSDDHWAEVEWVSFPSNYGPCCRSQDPTTTGRDYYHTQRFGTIYLSKIINGSQTNLANNTASSTAAGDVDRIEANGSTITGYINGSNDVSVTDTSLSGQLRGGFAIHVTGVTLRFDNFNESDIAVDDNSSSSSSSQSSSSSSVSSQSSSSSSTSSSVSSQSSTSSSSSSSVSSQSSSSSSSTSSSSSSSVSSQSSSSSSSVSSQSSTSSSTSSSVSSTSSSVSSQSSSSSSSSSSVSSQSSSSSSSTSSSTSSSESSQSSTSSSSSSSLSSQSSSSSSSFSSQSSTSSSSSVSSESSSVSSQSSQSSQSSTSSSTSSSASSESSSVSSQSSTSSSSSQSDVSSQSSSSSSLSSTSSSVSSESSSSSVSSESSSVSSQSSSQSSTSSSLSSQSDVSSQSSSSVSSDSSSVSSSSSSSSSISTSSESSSVSSQSEQSSSSQSSSSQSSSSSSSSSVIMFPDDVTASACAYSVSVSGGSFGSSVSGGDYATEAEKP